MTPHRRSLYYNPAAWTWTTKGLNSADVVETFHLQVEGHHPSPLVPLPSVAKSLGVKSVYAKDETNRLGLPAVTNLGLSWAVFRALTERLGLPKSSTIESVRKCLITNPVTLFAASDSNHGLAVARVGSLFAISVQIYVPSYTTADTIVLIRAEGAKLVVAPGKLYCDALSQAQAASREHNGILIQEEAIHDHPRIPQWMAEGYSTLMRELDSQLMGEQADLVVCPAGNSALVQAAVNYLKAPGRSPAAFIAVEPDTNPSLWRRLAREESAGVNDNREALLEAAWLALKHGIDASATVSDYEGHLASLELQTTGVSAGLAGASGLAALRRLEEHHKEQLGLNENSVLVLICTEGLSPYTTPKDVSSDDVITLTQTLVQFDSSNPDFGSTPGPGETAIANYITSWLEHRDIETHWIEPTQGRPSIIGVVRGSGGGKSLMFNGHMDTVTLLGYNGDPLSGSIVDGNMYGRGTADMKSGLAAGMLAVASAKSKKMKGDVILAAVADEESESVGTEQVLQAGWRADAAIVAEPTEMALINTHKGFALFEVDIHGVAAHGSRADLGVDAICKAGYFLVELDRHAQELQERFGDVKPETGAPNIHAGVVRGGEEIASYPALCTIFIERRTISGETADTVRLELLRILDKLAATVPNFKFNLRSTFSRAPYFIPRDHDFVTLVAKHAAQATGAKPIIKGETYWTDMALLDEKGIPGLIWGPKGYGLHAKTEWVEVESVRQLAEAFVGITEDFCK
ncbi:hypothetical protein N7510_010768 [Penicillium lagena]|uniref:uncharacterized protein n=1 Tax=Penicillium lagena TaxID=94218 RepID=UPI0025402E76|nr:uncharacterized protein N7510_010768 [Penicillium lagena]KAJ5601234.1 hypothetical protein N7510_010768 [Penicillium lagena]